MLLRKYWKTLYSLLSYSTSSNISTTKVIQENGVRTITLCNPKSRNALSLSTINELIDHMTTDITNIKLRCIIIKAEGPVFCSGHNLKEFNLSAVEQQHQRQVFSRCSRLMLEVVASPVPVVAVVDGLAAAAGCQLVAQCDIAVCTPRSSFSTPGASFGLFCSTPGIPVARSVGRKVALHMLLTGLPITAEQAYQSGLVSKVVPQENLDKEVKIITDAIQSKSRAVIALGKKFFYKQVEKDLQSAYKLGEDVMINNIALDDGQEGIKSFIEKRKPNWKHSSEDDK